MRHQQKMKTRPRSLPPAAASNGDTSLVLGKLSGKPGLRTGESRWHRQWCGKPGLNLDTGRTRICLLPLRLPSDWLSLDRSVFQLVAQTMGSRREPEPRENLQESHSPALPSKPPCEVQALCHHLATGPGQLSFHKGDVLRVLGPAGGDWLHCSRGSDAGLVPLAYVTLTPTPSSPPGSSQN